MLEFVARAFRVWMNLLLWLMLIGCAIGGFVKGGLQFGGFNFGSAVLGLIIGGLGGLIIVILSGGLIANFLNMVDNIKEIKEHLSKNKGTANGSSSSGSSIGLSSGSVSPAPQVNFGDTWTCKKCGEKNPATSSSCKGCGEYK